MIPYLAEKDLREIIGSLRLSAGFLSGLADANAAWQSTTSKMAFHAAMQRYRQAHDRMTTSNLKLVFSIAKKYVYSGLPLEDLVQEGNLGLIKAVERYDWRKGFRFSTFATWWIRQQIGRSVADSGRTVRLPVHVHEKVQSLRWMIRKYEAAHSMRPSLTTMAEAMSMRVDKVAPLLTYMEDILAIEDVDVDRLADPDFIARFHSDEPEAIAAGKEEAAKVAELLDSFPRKQRNILRLRYGIGVRDALTLEEVGQGMGVTRERVRQLESKALALLRHPARIEWLEGRPSAHIKRAVDESMDAAGGQEVLPTTVAAESSGGIHARRNSDTAEPAPRNERLSPLDQVLEEARALAIEFDDDRHGNTGRVRDRNNSQDRWKGYVWSGVGSEHVAEFFEGYVTHPQARKVNSALLRDFIRSMAATGELTSWTIALLEGGTPSRYQFDCGVVIESMTKRTADPAIKDRYTIGRLLSPRDEAIDLDQAAWSAALTLTRDNWNPDAARQKDGVKPTPPEVPSGPFIRRVRGKGAEGIPAAPQRGLLLLYPLHPEESGIVELKDVKEPIIAFGVSFPSSNSAVKVEYAVDHLLWEQEYGAAD